jgi:hypothetical protein
MSGVRYFFLPEPDTTASEPPALAVPDPAFWPPPWPRLLEKAPRRPRLVLTYLQLGQDLLGQGDQRRGGLWRALIRDLGWTGQSKVAFWPIALPEGDRIAAQADRFLQGLAVLAPAMVAFFGVAAASLLCREPTAEALSALIGVPSLILPDPAVLLAGDMEEWNHVLAQLEQL